MRLAVLFLFIAFAALAADPTAEIVTVAPSGGTYTTLNAWEAGEDDTGDLVASNVFHVVKIQGTWSSANTTAINVNGWTTDASHYICITNDTSKHDGKRYGSASGGYRLEVDNNHALEISENYTRVYGLQVKVSNAASDLRCIRADSSIAAGGSQIIVADCIFSGSSSANGAGITGVFINDVDATSIIFNCIGHGLKSQDNVDGYFVNANNNGSTTVYNCTAYDCYKGFQRGSGTLDTYNSIVQNCTDNWSGTIGGNYNRGDQTDAPGANSINDTDDVLFVSTTAGSEDFHLSPSEASNPNATSVIGYSTDQSSGLFTADAVGVVHSAAWDLGALKYVPAEIVTVAPSGGTYTTLNAWEAGEDDTGDLVASNVFHVVKIQGTWSSSDTTGFTIDGWTTDSSHYICITNDTSKHSGVWSTNTGPYSLCTANANAIILNEDFSRFYGLQIGQFGCSGQRTSIVGNTIGSGGTCTIANCIFTGTKTGSGYPYGFSNGDADLTATMYNCIGFNLTDGNFVTSVNGVNTVYNCSGFNNYIDYKRTAGTLDVYNSISQNSVLDGYNGTVGGDYNRSDRASDAPGANSINDTDDVLFVNTTAGSEDLHLSASEVSNPNATSVIGRSTDQSSGLFTTDAVGVTRGAVWDLGALEYVPAASAAKPSTILIKGGMF